MRAIQALGLVVACGGAFFGCTSGEEGCRPGDTVACTCTDEKGATGQGTQSCGAGHVFAPCKCLDQQPNQPGGGGGPGPEVDAGEDTAPPPQNPAKPRGAGPADVAIPAGAFTMGCDGTASDGCNDDAKPTHDVTLTAFGIDMTEVTQGEYNTCVGSGACKAPGTSGACAWDPSGRADFPVVCVSWDDAVAYCASQSKHLPTEAQWERAARGGGTPTTGEHSLYPWGDAVLTLDCDHANFYGFKGCELPATDVVGLRGAGASPEGVLDLSGNAAEWVSDFYQSNFYASSPASDPTGPGSGSEHVVRGGGYQTGTSTLQSVYRSKSSGPGPQIGFRCAK